MTELFVFDQLTRTRWGEALFALEGAIHSSHQYASAPDVLPTYRSLYRSLLDSGHADLASAVADELLYGDSALARASVRSSTIPAGLYEGAASDIMTLLYLLRRDWQEEASSMGNLIGQEVPPLAHLALASDQRHQRVSQVFADNLNNPDYDAERILEQLLAHYRNKVTARSPAMTPYAGTNPPTSNRTIKRLIKPTSKRNSKPSRASLTRHSRTCNN